MELLTDDDPPGALTRAPFFTGLPLLEPPSTCDQYFKVDEPINKPT